MPLCVGIESRLPLHVASGPLSGGWRSEGCMVAPVVGRGSCAAGSAPARAAAVWLSVWGSGDNREAIHTRPDRHRSPSPSVLPHQLSPPSFLSNSSDLTPPPRPPHFILYIPNLSVCLSVPVWPPPSHVPLFGFASISLPPTSHRNQNTSSCNGFSGKKMNSTAKSPQQPPESKFAEHPWAI